MRATTSRPALLAVAAAMGLALSAVQVLPSMEFTARSDRLPSPIGDRLLGHIEPGTHAEHTYDFSVGPWRLAEFVWPNLSGRQFPVHRRWLEVIPAEGRIWTPSLYMGLLPLLLALSAMRLRGRGGFRPPGELTRGERREKSEGRGGKPEGNRPDGRVEADEDHQTPGKRSPFSLLSSLFPLPSSPFQPPSSTARHHAHPSAHDDPRIGWYGLGWLADEVYSAVRGDPAGIGLVGAPCGGLYWLLTLVLPGYAYFRYPAKLLVVAALGLSLLAARGFDRVFTQPSVRFRRGLLWLGGLSLCGAAAVLAIRPFWDGWLSGVAPDPLFGPLDTSGAANDLLAAFLQTAVLCGFYWGLLRLATSGARWVALLALLLSAVDLAVANRWMVVCAPQGQWQEPSKVAAALQQEPPPGDGGPYRVFRDPIWTPPAWKTSGSPDRLAEAVRWDRDTLWPKYNLPERISLAEVQGTMMPQDYATFLSVAKEIDISRARGRGPGARGQGSGVRDQRPGGTPAGLSSLARYMILPGGKVLVGAERMNVGVEDTSLWHNPRCLPRAWIVHDLDLLPPLASNDPAGVRRRTEELLHPDDRPRDLRDSAIVETNLELTETTFPTAGESCRVVRYDPLRVEIEAELARPGLVILCDQFYTGWELQVETAGQCPRSVPILRTDRVMRGAWLPEGRHRLSYRYRPASITWGAAISGLAWLTVIGCVAARVMRRLRADD
jgi:hypothetical protein